MTVNFQDRREHAFKKERKQGSAIVFPDMKGKNAKSVRRDTRDGPIAKRAFVTPEESLTWKTAKGNVFARFDNTHKEQKVFFVQFIIQWICLMQEEFDSNFFIFFFNLF